jgi:hypothetical protein
MIFPTKVGTDLDFCIFKILFPGFCYVRRLLCVCCAALGVCVCVFICVFLHERDPYYYVVCP